MADGVSAVAPAGGALGSLQAERESTPPARLWLGRTVHARHTPFAQRFSYPVVMVDLDVERLVEAGLQSRLFSVDGFNLFGFRRRDHGDEQACLRAWAGSLFARAGLDLAGGRVRLLTFPRVLGYGFAPISLWLGYRPGGALAGIAYEVHNTFGDRHTYVGTLDNAGAAVRQVAGKRLHVSPFLDVSGVYRFVLHAGPRLFRLVVTNIEDGQRLHTASLLIRCQALDDAGLCRAALKWPLSGLGVSVGIHWEALKLWIRGARFRRRPSAPDQTTTEVETVNRH